ncbi:MAG: alanine--tRNA ligase [Pyrinomonadaceae bacterium]|nr:alanine--tRNA ligase [Pyrinomonadaceae bacterium]MCX7640825.1 alanine--tRNA ligase [Pyrinomonadaceae bacterium]MDW8303410.1 alanine--tRNA ligase [Acidobacteriota bacterium]
MITGHEIREKFLGYFEKHGHKRVHSSPLLPANDPTLLFTNAGMNQFKDLFTGVEKRDYKRAVSAQKCIRAGGKHNDLDEVGRTARHHTFFEMLGNFSFGDYFKREAIRFAWDFLVNELKLDVNRLWFTIFEGDSEIPEDSDARRYWIEVGASPERILGFGRKDNFWQMGETGPCGPCSEIHYYMGDEPENPLKNRAELVNAPQGDQTIEIWNLVFMQFERIEAEKKGIYYLKPLPAPSVDTGMGLERITAVLQGVKSNYETDLIKPIVDFTATIAGKSYEADTIEGFAMRVIADHARATAFAIADGILPGNEGRNYVLRKIMRRAIYQAREHLGLKEPFLYKVCDFVIDLMKKAYPELEAQRDFVLKMTRLEEERFGKTLTVGLEKLKEVFGSNKSVEFKELARLYDTFGVPRDLIRVKLIEQGHQMSEEEFNERFDEALQEIQNNSEIGKTSRKSAIKPIYQELAEKISPSVFRGYDTTRIDGTKVTALIRDEKEVQELKEAEEGLIVLEETPFYAEAGGQVGDTGILVSQDAKVKVLDTFSPIQGLILHKSRVEKGTIRLGDLLTAIVDEEKRDATRRNHTATHLLHAALKEVLGSHVKQAGSVVAPDFLRFDYTHYQPLTDEEIKEIEDLVNYYILRNEPVRTDIMQLEEAISSGAVALFGEKYGSQVRVLSVGDGKFSKELCGGTHVRATGDIGIFKIISDEAIAAGTRRIRAITGFEAIKRFQEDEKIIEKATESLKADRRGFVEILEKLQDELKRLRRENEDLRLKIITSATGPVQNGDVAREIKGVKVLTKVVEGLDKGAMRHLSDTLLARLKSGVVILAKRDDGKVAFIVRVSEDLTDKVKAGKIINEIAPVVAGRGGGRDDMAEGGGSLTEKLEEALEKSYKVVESMLSS